jgi:2-oxoglutarate ferredoxin oxidoreductase subunit alpha
MRAGPGLGGIQPAQADYFQATKGGGHGDYNLLVYAPASVQEAADLTQKAFVKADQYRNPVLVLGDSIVGQMMEPAEVSVPTEIPLPSKLWATRGWDDKSRPRAVINSLFLTPEILEQHNLHLQRKFTEIANNEIMVQCEGVDDADIIIVAYGTTARIVKSAMKMASEKGIKCGLVRPITLWPFPYKVINEVSAKAKAVLVVEMSAGQMLYDVDLALKGTKEASFYGTLGGIIPKEKDIYREILKIMEVE